MIRPPPRSPLSPYPPLSLSQRHEGTRHDGEDAGVARLALRVLDREAQRLVAGVQDRKSTRLNSSHANISYAVFCLKKKKKNYSTVLVCTELVTTDFSHVPHV